jgi:hypothetical protein
MNPFRNAAALNVGAADRDSRSEIRHRNRQIRNQPTRQPSELKSAI